MLPRRPVSAPAFALVLALRLLCFIAIAASAALIVEYMNAGDPAFCGVGSGCLAVRMSKYSSFLGVPLPFIGLFAFAGLFAVSLVSRTRTHYRLLAAAATLGTLGGLALIYLQKFVIGAICPWCFAVDSAAILVAPVALRLMYEASTHPPPPEAADGAEIDPSKLGPFWSALTATGAETLIWGGAAALAIALPFIWGRYPVIPDPPPTIAALTEPGKVTIVGFTDFQCPFCRDLYPAMRTLEQKYGDRVRYLRRMYPLPSHPGALPAAQAYLCAPEDKREAAAEWLYTTHETNLSRTGVLDLADVIGVPRIELGRCLTSPETQALLARDKELYDSTGARGLPLTYVGPRMVVGAKADRVERAVEAELAGAHISLKVPWLFVALGLIAVGAVALTVRIKSQIQPPKSAA